MSLYRLDRAVLNALVTAAVSGAVQGVAALAVDEHLRKSMFSDLSILLRLVLAGSALGVLSHLIQSPRGLGVLTRGGAAALLGGLTAAANAAWADPHLWYETVMTGDYEPLLVIALAGSGLSVGNLLRKTPTEQANSNGTR